MRETRRKTRIDDIGLDPWASLGRDWERRASRIVASSRILEWADCSPRLVGFDSVVDLTAAIASLGNPKRSCALLADLLVIAGRDQFAREAVLIAVIPGLRGAARRRWTTARRGGPWQERFELDVDTITMAWHSINQYAGQRHVRPARLIVRRVERGLRTVHDAYRRHQNHLSPLGNTQLDIVEYNPPVGTAALINEAVRAGRLNHHEGTLAYLVAIEGRSPSTVSRQFGLTRHQAQSALRRAAAALGLPLEASPPEPVRRRPSPRHIRSEEDFPMLPLLLTVNQAAELLGVGRTTVYELMDSGELFSVHRGASRRIPLWAAYDYVDRLCGGTFRQIPLPAVVDYLARLGDRGRNHAPTPPDESAHHSRRVHHPIPDRGRLTGVAPSDEERDSRRH